MTTSYKYPCHEAYQKGLADRQKHPFVSSSLYKIREFQRRSRRLPDNLINIGNCSVGNKKACNNLRGCTSYDKAAYTKKQTCEIAYDLAFKLVSALPSLKHEGLAQNDIDGITAYVNSQIKRLIDLAEQASRELKSNWKQTARDLRFGEGGVYELSLEVLALLDWVMTEVELCKQLP